MRLFRAEAQQPAATPAPRSEEHTSELQSPCNLVCRLLLEKKKQSILPVSPLYFEQHLCVKQHNILLAHNPQIDTIHYYSESYECLTICNKPRSQILDYTS